MVCHPMKAVSFTSTRDRGKRVAKYFLIGLAQDVVFLNEVAVVHLGIKDLEECHPLGRHFGCVVDLMVRTKIAVSMRFRTR